MFLEVGKIFHGFLKSLKGAVWGGMGKYIWQEDILERRVALKVVEKQTSTDSWEREWRGLKIYARNIAFSHPELVAIYHAGEDNDLFYYTMERQITFLTTPIIMSPQPWKNSSKRTPFEK